VILSPEPQLNSDEFTSLYHTLSAYTSNFCLMAVMLRQSQSDSNDFGIDYIKGIGRSSLVAMKPVSKAGPLTFEDPFDDFMFWRAIVTFGNEARKHHCPILTIRASDVFVV
jgi:hypothetical protein